MSKRYYYYGQREKMVWAYDEPLDEEYLYHNYEILTITKKQFDEACKTGIVDLKLPTLEFTDRYLDWLCHGMDEPTSDTVH